MLAIFIFFGNIQYIWKNNAQFAENHLQPEEAIIS
jgi:hypothetical protein